MIIEKSIDTSEFGEYLSTALINAFECGEFQGLWVQKYEDEGTEYWEASTNDPRAGKNLLHRLEIVGVKHYFDGILQENDAYDFDWLIGTLEHLIETRWEEKHTIEVETYCFKDYYDMYGVNEADFY